MRMAGPLKRSILYLSRRWASSLVLGALVGATLVGLVLVWGGMDDVWRQRRAISLPHLGGFVLATMAVYWLRAWRFHLLLRARGALARLCGVVSVHTLMLNLLPFGSGEVTYPVLLKRYGIADGLMEGVPSIVIARLQDSSIYLAFLVLALAWTGDLLSVVRWAVDSVPLAAVAAVPAMGVAALLLWKGLGRRLPLSRDVGRPLRKVAAILRSIPPSVWLGTIVIALAARSAALLGVIFLFQALGLHLSFSTVFLITSLYVFLPYLPINTPAGLGVTEGYLAAMFVHAGIDRSVAAAASLQSHLLQLLVVAVLGALGLLGLQYMRGRGHASKAPRPVER